MSERIYNNDPEILHKNILNAYRPLLPWDGGDVAAYAAKARAKLGELMGMPEIAPAASALTAGAIIRRGEVEHGGFKGIAFMVETEDGFYSPCKLLFPDGEAPEGGWPVMLCIQGHSTGMHISVGDPQFEGDAESIAGDRDFALQAARKGYAALAVEQRCLGMCSAIDTDGSRKRCRQASVQALLLGRTMIGERIFDLCRVIDELPTLGLANIDTDTVYCMGNSGGGTAAFFLACMCEKLTGCMPSCYFCSLKESIFPILHCECNYIPGMLKWFDLGDLCALIAPRPMVIVAGKEDDIFPLTGVESQFDICRKIYAAAGAADKCELVVGEGGHRFYAPEAWPVFKKITKN